MCTPYFIYLLIYKIWPETDPLVWFSASRPSSLRPDVLLLLWCCSASDLRMCDSIVLGVVIFFKLCNPHYAIKDHMCVWISCWGWWSFLSCATRIMRSKITCIHEDYLPPCESICHDDDGLPPCESICHDDDGLPPCRRLATISWHVLGITSFFSSSCFSYWYCWNIPDIAEIFFTNSLLILY